jgi:hypothetical protein
MIGRHCPARLRMEKWLRMAWFCGNDSVSAAGRCSGSVSTAIADIVIAVRNAAFRRGSNNDGEPTVVINAARKGSSIIAIGSGNTAGENNPV